MPLFIFSRRISYKVAGLLLLALVLLWTFAYKLHSEWSTLAWSSAGNHALTSSAPETLGHPTFADIREYERTLPQRQGMDTKGPRSKRYVYFPRESWGTGWNNVFQEQLLNTHLAYLADRGYIFVDYIPRDHPPFPDTLPDGTRQMLHIPMNAFTAGPTGGGSLGAYIDSAAPIAASLDWWHTVCPAGDVVKVDTGAMAREFNFTDETPGNERLAGWANTLLKIEAACVEVVGGPVFEYWIIGSRTALLMWPSYGSSPTLKEFAWSPLITRALARNYALFSPSPLRSELAPQTKGWIRHLNAQPSWPDSVSAPHPLIAFRPYRTSATPITGLLGVHVRRGDYEGHCNFLADIGADYNAWNQFGLPEIRSTGKYPQLPDYLDVPEGMSRRDAAHEHCWPTPAQIVQNVREVRKTAASGYGFPAQELRAVYIATNGNHDWVAGIVTLLREDGWEMVSTSLDLALAKDEVAVGQAIDSAVLVSAESFIGVGFSSMSSNVVQLRLGARRHPNTIRFW
ncbi:hypothetical protein C8R47DRAFT_1277087 [Mycena vitilis]|nr:hypothetical protein C8R47DRAFT_1277087 [Mycena vitilis]